MTVFAYRQATAHGASVSFVPMLVSSVLISLAAGYVLILICMPLFLRLLLRRKDIDPDAGSSPGRH